MALLTGFQRTGSPVYDGTRPDRQARDRYSAGDVSFSEAGNELVEFAWDLVPHVFERIVEDNDGRVAYAAGTGYNFQASQTVQRKFTSYSSAELLKGFLGDGEDFTVLDNPWFPYMVYSGALGASGDNPGSGAFFGPFSGESVWAVDTSDLANDPDTGEHRTLSVRLRATGPINYGQDLERYTIPDIDDIPEMYRMSEEA